MKSQKQLYPHTLYKHCGLEHNLADGCKTVRIGSLETFRRSTDETKDEGEGIFSLKFDFGQPTEVGTQWFAAAMNPTHGTSSQHLDGEVTFSPFNASVQSGEIGKHYGDCWVYCLSFEPKIDGTIGDKYPSKWHFDMKHIKGFAQALTNALGESLTPDDLPDSLVQRYGAEACMKEVSIAARIGEVEYIPRSFSFSSIADLPLEEVHRLNQQIPFIKPKCYEREKEYRIIFILKFRNSPVFTTRTAKLIEPDFTNVDPNGDFQILKG